MSALRVAWCWIAMKMLPGTSWQKLSVPQGMRQLMHQRVHETLLDRGPLLFVSNDVQQVRWMKEESPWIYPGECQIVDSSLMRCYRVVLYPLCYQDSHHIKFYSNNKLSHAKKGVVNSCIKSVIMLCYL